MQTFQILRLTFKLLYKLQKLLKTLPNKNLKDGKASDHIGSV